MSKVNYSEEFGKYWDVRGRYHSVYNPGRTRNSICNWLKSCECIEDIDDYVCGLQSRRETTRRIIVDFFDYLERTRGEKVFSVLTEKTFYDHPVERQLEIAKYLHERHSIKEIEERFDIKSGARKSDLQALREGIEFLGSTIKIEEETEGRKKYYRTTMHPVFLPLNLTEVYMMTSYLPKLVKPSSANYELVQDIVERIKVQLSDYAHERLFPNELRRNVSNDYINDEELSQQRKGVLMYLMKTGERCKFFWKGEEYYGRIKYSNNRSIIQLDDGSVLDVDPEKYGEIEFIILNYK